MIQSPQFLQAITSGEAVWCGLSIPRPRGPQTSAPGAPPLAGLAAGTATDPSQLDARHTAPFAPA